MVYTDETVCSAIVKQRTKGVHAATEALLVRRLNAIRSKDDYVIVLKMFYDFFSPIEKQIEQHISIFRLPDIEKRKRSALILHDLKGLQATGPVATSTCLYAISNILQAFGALYVLEGSALGGKIIAQMLKSNDHIQLTDNYLNFFNGYGCETMPMWNDFRTALNRVAADTAQIEEVADAAIQTFENLKYRIEITDANYPY